MSNRIFVGYESPKGPSEQGRIYLDQAHFANFWKNIENGKYCLNRTALALAKQLPCAPMFDTVDDMVTWLNRQPATLPDANTCYLCKKTDQLAKVDLWHSETIDGRTQKATLVKAHLECVGEVVGKGKATATK